MKSKYKMNISDLLQEYLLSLKSYSTRVNYQIALKDFLKNYTNISDITPSSLENYRKNLQKKRKTLNTIKAKFSAIRGFLDYCWFAGHIQMNPADKIKFKPIKKYINAKNIQKSDFQKILKQIPKTPKGLRDLLLLNLVYLLGDLDAIISYKWNQPIADVSLAKIKLQLEENIKKQIIKTDIELRSWNNFQQGYLFFSLDKGMINPKRPITLAAIRRMLRRYCGMAGFPETHIDLQALKRLRAKEIYQQTKSLEAVRKFCKHQTLQITKKFLGIS